MFLLYFIKKCIQYYLYLFLYLLPPTTAKCENIIYNIVFIRIIILEDKKKKNSTVAAAEASHHWSATRIAGEHSTPRGRETARPMRVNHPRTGSCSLVRHANATGVTLSTGTRCTVSSCPQYNIILLLLRYLFASRQIFIILL